MEDSQDICGTYSPSIYAQDPNFCSPTEGLGKYVQEALAKKAALKKKQKRDAARRNCRDVASTSYVITKDQKKGKRLIQIQVVDLENEAAAYSRSSAETTQCSENDNDNGCVILSAQYVMRDSIDEIMDLTENLIKKISRKITSDDYF